MLVLGVDGGGTKTFGVVADRSGEVVAFVTGPDTNPLDQPRWADHFSHVVRDALRGFDIHDIAGAAVGLPVHGEIGSVSAEQRALATILLGRSVVVRNDVHTAHEGAFAGRRGVLLLAGTGSMCWAADDAGRQVRVGGWGDAFGDEGSAHWIGHRAVSLASRILDGRLAGGGFADAVLGAMGLARDGVQEAMLRWFYNHPNRRPAVAALAVTVDRLAEAGDAVATGLMDRAADALALHVRTARQILALGDEWVFVGGVSRSATMQRLLTARLGASRPALLPPVGGAVWRAAQEAGWAPDAAWIARLDHSLKSRLEPA